MSAQSSDARSGLAQGGLGAPEDELREAGQEDVFSRTEVETGRNEPNTDTQARRRRRPARPYPPPPSHTKKSQMAEKALSPGLLFGFTGLDPEGDPAHWPDRPVVLPEGWRSIPVQGVWLAGRAASPRADQGAGRAVIEFH